MGKVPDSLGNEDARNIPDLGAKLRELVRRCGMSRAEFIEDFAARERVREVTVRDWLPDEAEGVTAHRPLRGSQKKIIHYFSAKLGVEISYDVFNCRADEFALRISSLLEQSRSTRRELRIPLPTKLDSLSQANLDEYLCGTYKAFRYSFSQQKRSIVGEIVSIYRSENDSTTLGVEMLCVPALDISIADLSPLTRQNKPPQLEPERFNGSLCKYGDTFHLTVAHFNERTHDRRIRCLQFPLIKTRRLVHYGLTMGYSANLDEPACARILAFKVSSQSKVNSLLINKYVKNFDPSEPSIADLLELLDNHVSPQSDVLSVNKLDTRLWALRQHVAETE